MLKAFGKLWLKSVKRIAKVQAGQQARLQKKLVKAVLAPPARRRVAAKSVAPKRVAANSARAAPARSINAALPGTLAEGGTWTRGYHVLPVSLQTPTHTQGRRLLYWLFMPACAPQAVAGKPASPALVVMLHGCDQSAEDFARGTRMNRLAARHGFAVLYPQQSKSAHPQRCWPWYKQGVQQGHGEAALVAGAIEKEVLRHGLDRSRIYAAGLSAGAAMAQILALRHPELIAAVGSHSGPAYGVADSRLSAFSVMQQGGRDIERPITTLLQARPDFPEMPIMILQGQHDPVVRSPNGLALSRQFSRLNRLPLAASGAPVSKAARGKCDAYRLTDHGRRGKTLVRLCEIAHLEHAWSGGDAALRYNAAKGPDASALLWQFFKRHRRL